MPSKAIKPTTVRLHPDLLRRADRLAKLMHCTRSMAIAHAALEGLKRLERTHLDKLQQITPASATSVFD